ncbi:hypothetical protein BH23CHL5_BH23CHL5_19350 [soil metagenome]
MWSGLLPMPRRPSGQFDAAGYDEEKRASDDRTTVWGFIWVLFFFKVVTVLATAWAAGFTHEASLLLSITTWPWLIIPALGLAGPFLFRYRLRVVRRRKVELLRSEWMTDRHDSSSIQLTDAGNSTRRGT